MYPSNPLAFSATSCYGIQKLMKHTLEDDLSNLEKILDGINDDKRKDVQKTMDKITYTNLTLKIPKIIVKSAGTTALKTGVGYVIGYSFANALFS